MKKNKLFVYILIICLYVAFVLRGYLYLDPDFGYRLTTGQMIISRGVPRTDPYSYTMPSYPYVEHASLVAVSWAVLFPLVGKFGLSLIFAGLAITSLFIVSMSVREVLQEFVNKIFPEGRGLFFLSSLPFLLATALILAFSGVRAQIVSWVMFSFLFYLILDISRWNKWRALMPFVFLIWANLHGSFAGGLITILIFLLIRSFRKKRFLYSDYALLAVSVFSTFVNPYYFGAWREFWSSVTDAKLRWTIAEWMPALLMDNFAMVYLLTLSTFFVYKLRKHFPAEVLGIYFFFLIQAISSRRQLPVWALLAAPLTSEAVFLFYKEIKSIKNARKRFKKVYRAAYLVGIFIFIVQLVSFARETGVFREGGFYPKEAVSYLKGDLPDGRIFSSYGWGGYLIWKMPEKKVFVDGRMPSWRWDAPEGELDSAFDTYNEILSGSLDYRGVFDEFNIDTVVWHSSEKLGRRDKLENKLRDLLGGKFEKERASFLEKLEGDGWIKVYDDKTATIYRRE